MKFEKYADLLERSVDLNAEDVDREIISENNLFFTYTNVEKIDNEKKLNDLFFFLAQFHYVLLENLKHNKEVTEYKVKLN